MLSRVSKGDTNRVLGNSTDEETIRSKTLSTRAQEGHSLVQKHVVYEVFGERESQRVLLSENLVAL